MENCYILILLLVFLPFSRVQSKANYSIPLTPTITDTNKNCSMHKWHNGDGLCFLYVNESMTWQKAQDYCRRYNAYLPVFDSYFSDYIGDNAMRFLANRGNLEKQWCGIHLVNGKLWWEHDVHAPVRLHDQFYNWKGGSINKSKGSCGVVAEFTSKPSLKLDLCTRRKKFTCFRLARDNDISTINDVSCPSDWRTSFELNYCFKEYHEQKPFSEARQSCKDVNSSIWQLTEPYELDIISDYLKREEKDGDFYYEKKESRTHACNYLRGSTTFHGNCSVQRRYICQRETVVPEVLLAIQRNLYELSDTKEEVYYTNSSFAWEVSINCLHNFSRDQRTVWVKDQSYIGHNDMFESFIPFNYFSPFVEERSLNVYIMQGIYQCEIWMPMSRRTKSNQKRLIFTDVLTSWLYLVAEIDTNIDFSMLEILDVNKLTLARFLHERMCFPTDIMDIDICFYPVSVVKILNDNLRSEKNTITLKMAVYSNISRTAISKYFRQPLLPDAEKYQMSFMEQYFKEISIEIRSIFQERSYDTHEYLRILEQELIPARKKREYPTEEREEFIFHTINLKSTHACQPELLNSTHGIVRFEIGLLETFANSTSICANRDLTPLALGRCNGSYEDGYSWIIIDVYECIPDRKDKSSITNELVDIFNDLDTTGNKVDEGVIDHMEDLTAKNKKEMSSTDVNVVSKFVETVADRIDSIEENVGQTLMNIVSNSMEAPLDKGRESKEDDKRIAESKMGLIQSLEAVVSKVELSTSNATWTTNQFLVHIDKSPGGAKSFGVIAPDNDDNGTYIQLSGSDVTENDDITVGIVIPAEAYKNAEEHQGIDDGISKIEKSRTNVIIYKSESMFTDPNCQDKEGGTVKLNSFIVSSSINGVDLENLTDKIKLRFKIHEKASIPTCVYAEKILNGNTWKWSERGLNQESYNNETGIVECSSNHMTNFAVLAGFCEPPHTLTAKALSFISIFGAVISIVCLTLVITCQMFFKKFRKGQYQLALLNLSIALIVVNLLVLLGLDRTKNEIVCMVAAALLHYFLLVAFSWMLIEAILQYYKFVKVFNVHVRKFVLKAVLPAWILPGIVVIITACIDYKQFRGPEKYCWLNKNAFYFAFLLPLGVIVLTNTIIFARIVKGISCDRPKGMQTNQTKSQLIWLQVQAGICCFVVMGLTWCFALFAFGKAALVMQFLFAIFNSLQGFFVFVLFNLREKQVRKAWTQLLCKRKSGKKFIFSSESSGSKSKDRNKTDDILLSSSDLPKTKNAKSSDTRGS